MRYNFFYDETEHSRKINYKTITADNYYDNFISVIVGWASEDEAFIKQRYLDFEKKYSYRKVNGELKSQTMKTKDFRFGFASLSKNNIDFYDDLISLFDNKVIIYFSVSSKIEYLIHQMLSDYQNTMVVQIDLLKYSVIKGINVYRPEKVIEAIYADPQVFLDELKCFLHERLAKNQANIELKKRENQAFAEILMVLENTKAPVSIDWSYIMSFDGFKKLLDEMKVTDYNLILDREGDESHTLRSAKDVGLYNVTEESSESCFGIRMADMLAGILFKFMQSLRCALTGTYIDGEIKKILLPEGWFALNQRQYDLYKKLFQVICVDNNYWYKSYAGIYADELVSFIALLQFMNGRREINVISKDKLKILPEHYNSLVCSELEEHYSKISS